MIYASNNFACSRQTSDYANERALNRAETSVGKSDEISNYRFSGGRWAKPSNRDIFGRVMISPFFAGFWELISATKVAGNCWLIYAKQIRVISCFFPQKNVPIFFLSLQYSCNMLSAYCRDLGYVESRIQYDCLGKLSQRSSH